MADPIFSPDGKFMWTGSEWIPAPPKETEQSSVDLDIHDSVVMGDITIINSSTEKRIECTKCDEAGMYSTGSCPVCMELKGCQNCELSYEYKKQVCDNLTDLKESACIDCFEEIYQEGCDKVCSNCNVCFVAKITPYGKLDDLCFYCLEVTKDLESDMESLNHHVQELEEKSEKLVGLKLKLQEISNTPDPEVEEYQRKMEVYHRKMEVYHKKKEEIDSVEKENEERRKNGLIQLIPPIAIEPFKPIRMHTLNRSERISSEIEDLERNIKHHKKMISLYQPSCEYNQSRLAKRREYPSKNTKQN